MEIALNGRETKTNWIFCAVTCNVKLDMWPCVTEQASHRDRKSNGAVWVGHAPYTFCKVLSLKGRCMCNNGKVQVAQLNFLRGVLQMGILITPARFTPCTRSWQMVCLLGWYFYIFRIWSFQTCSVSLSQEKSHWNIIYSKPSLGTGTHTKSHSVEICQPTPLHLLRVNSVGGWAF